MSIFNGTGSMQTLQILEKGMDVGVLRSNILSNNIANVSVPHFKRSEVSFESELKRAVDSIRVAKEDERPLRTNNGGHMAISPFRIRSIDGVGPRVHIDYLSKVRNDGNNVDIEDESMKITRNQMQYSFLTNRTGDLFRKLNHLIRLA